MECQPRIARWARDRLVWASVGVATVAALVATPHAVGETDALATYRDEARRLARIERRFWDDYQGRQNRAFATWLDASRARRAETARLGVIPKVYVDVTGYRALFDDICVIQQQRGDAAMSLARSGHERAAATLIAELFRLADDIDEVEASFEKAGPQGGWGCRSQEPSVRRHGLAAFQAPLERAIAALPEAVVAFTDDGYARACKRDGNHSLVRRVAVLDILGASEDPSARAFLVSALTDDRAFIRMAAVQGLVRRGTKPTDALVRVLADPCSVVRRVVLSEVRNEASGAAQWTLPVLTAYAKSKHQERAECIATLRALTGAHIGDDFEAWEGWVTAHFEDIGRGTIRRPGGRSSETNDTEIEGGVEFYGARSPSQGVIFVLDGTGYQDVPADYDVQRTRWWGDWVFGAQGWQEEHESHWEVQLREFRKALASLPDDALFGVVMNKETAAVKTLGEKRLLRANPLTRRKALAFLESHAPRGFRAELSNIITAMEMAGLEPHAPPLLEEPRADTVFLVCDGSLRGGHYVVPEVALAAFQRLNRFRRLVVHSIRTRDAGPESESFLRGLAEVSNGTYRWCRKPPP